MKQSIQHDAYGTIEYDESFWTGKKNISFDGAPLQKVNRKTFLLPSGEQAVIEGSYLTGSRLRIGEERIQLTPAIKWYEILLSLLPFLLIMVWGNSVQLCQIVPVVGGAIGGFISALIGMVNMLIIKSLKPVWLKILISVCMLAGTFLICWLIGSAIVAALT